MKKLALSVILALAATPALAAFDLSIQGLVEIIIYIIVIGGIFWLLFFLIDYCGLPAPFNKVAKVILMVVGVLILIELLLGFVGHPLVNLR